MCSDKVLIGKFHHVAAILTVAKNEWDEEWKHHPLLRLTPPQHLYNVEIDVWYLDKNIWYICFDPHLPCLFQVHPHLVKPSVETPTVMP